MPETNLDYAFWLSHESWGFITTAFLLNGIDPRNSNLRITPYSSVGKCDYHLPLEQKAVLRHIQIFETWGISENTPNNWIERVIREGIQIPEHLWEVFKLKFLRDSEYNKNLSSIYPAIIKKIEIHSQEKQLTQRENLNILPRIRQSNSQNENQPSQQCAAKSEVIRLELEKILIQAHLKHNLNRDTLWNALLNGVANDSNSSFKRKGNTLIEKDTGIVWDRVKTNYHIDAVITWYNSTNPSIK